MEDGDKVFSFVRCFYGSSSTFLWKTRWWSPKTFHTEREESRATPLMPLLFCLGTAQGFGCNHVSRKGCLHFHGRHLRGVHAREGWRCLCHHRSGAVCPCDTTGKTKCGTWRRGANDMDVLTSAGRERVPDAVVWKGDPELPAVDRGLKVLGAPFGHPENVQEFLRRKSEEQQVFFPAHTSCE